VVRTVGRFVAGVQIGGKPLLPPQNFTCIKKTNWAVQSQRGNPCRRYFTNVQRLRAGFYLHSCRSAFFQERGYSTRSVARIAVRQRRTTGRLRLPFGSSAGTPVICSVAASRQRCRLNRVGMAGILPRLLPGSQGQWRAADGWRQRRGAAATSTPIGPAAVATNLAASYQEPESYGRGAGISHPTRRRCGPFID